MSRQRVRILMIGEESASAKALTELALTGHHIVAVMTSPASGAQRNSPVAAVAQQLGYEVWPARLVKDPAFSQKLKSERVDIVLNVHSKYIIDEQVLKAARIGGFNMHPGPLPEYAGLNCVSWALYRGETRYGVTIHWMAGGIDTGDVASRTNFQIEPNDTPLSLTHKCVRAGVPELIKLVETASANPEAIPKLPQDLSQRKYFGREIPEGGRLSWTRPAGAIVDLVRACDYAPFTSPWGLPKTMWQNREVAIAKAGRTYEKCDREPGTVGDCSRSGVFIASADEWVSVWRLKIGGEYVEPQAILHPGSRLYDERSERAGS
jgi:methionyl-tRNA formyltransferase